MSENLRFSEVYTDVALNLKCRFLCTNLTNSFNEKDLEENLPSSGGLEEEDDDTDELISACHTQ